MTLNRKQTLVVINAKKKMAGKWLKIQPKFKDHKIISKYGIVGFVLMNGVQAAFQRIINNAIYQPRPEFQKGGAFEKSNGKLQYNPPYFN